MKHTKKNVVATITGDHDSDYSAFRSNALKFRAAYNSMNRFPAYSALALSEKANRAPMIVREAEKSLFEYEDARPQSAP